MASIKLHSQITRGLCRLVGQDQPQLYNKHKPFCILKCEARRFSSVNVNAKEIDIISNEVGISVPGGTLAGKRHQYFSSIINKINCFLIHFFSQPQFKLF